MVRQGVSNLPHVNQRGPKASPQLFLKQRREEVCLMKYNEAPNFHIIIPYTRTIAVGYLCNIGVFNQMSDHSPAVPILPECALQRGLKEFLSIFHYWNDEIAEELCNKSATEGLRLPELFSTDRCASWLVSSTSWRLSRINRPDRNIAFWNGISNTSQPVIIFWLQNKLAVGHSKLALPDQSPA